MLFLFSAHKIPRNYSILEVGKKNRHNAVLFDQYCKKKNIIKGKRDDEEHLMTHQSIPYDDKKKFKKHKTFNLPVHAYRSQLYCVKK